MVMGHEPIRRAVAALDRLFFEDLGVVHLPPLCNETVYDIWATGKGSGGEGRGAARGQTGKLGGVMSGKTTVANLVTIIPHWNAMVFPS